MLRKAVVSLFIAIIGLFAFSGMASADPTNYPGPGDAGDPRISAPASGDVGGIATVAGEAFEPNEVVYVVVTAPDGTTRTALVTADENGNISIPVPLVLSGSYSVQAAGMRTGLVSQATIQSVGSASGGVTTPPVSSGPTQVVNNGVIVGVNNGTIIVNNGTIFYGEGFVAGENVTINIVYYGKDAVKADTIIVVADADGKIRHEIKPSRAGTVVVSAKGGNGGGEISVNVTGDDSDSGWAAVATTTVGGKNVIAVAPNGSYLASTGASIAGPIAIGGAALVAGLGLLFFGTRGAIRRKGGHVQS